MIIRLDECESTHEYMRENIDCLQPWTVVTSEYQTGGHGRHGRVWVSPKGKNLCFNVLLPTKDLKAEFYAGTTQIAAIALARMLREKNINASVKWPNDVLVKGRKICGIISTLQMPYISLGIGLNVNMENTEYTSMLIETGKSWDRDVLLQEFLQRFKASFKLLCEKGLRPFIEEWRCMGCFVGHKARVVEGELALEGIIDAVQDDGSLLFRTEGGLKTIWSGDLEV